jgi:hypothetical protein
MSDRSTELPSLDLREQIVRIDHALDEAAKLRSEANKLRAEETKLYAEARKFDRDRWIAPWLAIVGLIGGIATAAGAIWRLFH